MAGQIGNNQDSQRSKEPGQTPGSTAIEETHPIKFKWSPRLRAADESDKTGAVWDVVIIRAGKSDNGPFYSPKVLQESTPLFEGAAIYEYRWGEKKDGEQLQRHVDKKIQRLFPEGLVGNLVGELREVKWDDSENALVGRVYIDDEDLRTRLKNRYLRGSENMPGLSIDADGSKRGDFVESIEFVHSTDIVTYPAAGGKFKRLVAGNAVADTEDYAWELRGMAAQLAEAQLSPDNRMQLFSEMQAVMGRMADTIALEESMSDSKKTNATGLKEMGYPWRQIAFLAEQAMGAEDAGEVMEFLVQIKAVADEYVSMEADAAMETGTGEDDYIREGDEKSKKITESADPSVATETSGSTDETPSTESEEDVVDKETAAKLEEENTSLREDVEAMQARLREQAFEHEFDKVATELKIVDREAAQMLLDPKTISYTDEGAIEGLREALEALVEARPWLKESKPTPPDAVGLAESRDVEDGVGGMTKQAVKRKMAILKKKAIKGCTRSAREFDKLQEALSL